MQSNQTLWRRGKCEHDICRRKRDAIQRNVFFHTICDGGSAALLMEWGIVRENDIYLYGGEGQGLSEKRG